MDTNTNSDNATFGTNSTSTKGNFTINKIAPNSGTSAPTIDLYCSGNIIVHEYQYPTFSDGWPEELKNVVYAGREGWDFTVTNDYFPNSGNVNIAWNHSGYSYVGPDYYDWSGSRYTFYIAGDYISVTTNWNNSRISSQNASDSGTLPGCNAYEANNREIPEITCRWELIMGFNRQDIPQPFTPWQGQVVNVGSDQLAVRSEPYIPSDYYSNIVGWLSNGQIVTVSDESAGWYYVGNGWSDSYYIERL